MTTIQAIATAAKLLREFRGVPLTEDAEHVEAFYARQDEISDVMGVLDRIAATPDAEQSEIDAATAEGKVLVSPNVAGWVAPGREQVKTITDMARLGGQSRSVAKIAAVRLNGTKGGRPRKDRIPPES